VGADGDEASDPLDPLDPQLAIAMLINATARRFFVMDATFMKSSSKRNPCSYGSWAQLSDLRSANIDDFADFANRDKSTYESSFINLTTSSSRVDTPNFL
jgi:hypothetical protein